MSQPLVSFITPTYNHEKYISACIQSVLAQTWPHWEMIIIDDGSTDRTADMVKSFSDPRVKYIHQNHAGIYRLGDTYNKALSAAQGEIIAILEGDDYIPNHKLEYQIPAFDEPEVVLSYGDFFTANETGKIFAEFKISSIIPDKSARENRPVGSALKKLLIPDSFFTHPVTTCIRKETLLKIGGFRQWPELPTVDVPTFCRLALEGEFRYINEPLGYWRKHSKNTTMVELSRHDLCYEYCLDFLAENRSGISRLGAGIEVDVLKQALAENRMRFNLSQEYIKGAKHLEISEMKQARACFLQYLKNRHKTPRLIVLAGLGIFSSYLGVNLARPLKLTLGAIKRYLNAGK